MKTEVKYGLICEDLPQRIFVEKILTAITLHKNSSKKFTEDISFAKRYRGAATNKKLVEKLYVEACIQAKGIYNLDVCIVGVDLDDSDDEKFKTDYKKMVDSLPDSLKKSTLVFIPVQCIEHWLWYIKWHIENPKSTQNISLKDRHRKDAKIEVYGRIRPHDENKINALLDNVNLEWLCSRSFSFNHFYNLIIAFLNQ